MTTLALFAGSNDSFSILSGPSGLAVDFQGNVYVADQYNSRILKIDPDGNDSIVVDSGLTGPTDVVFGNGKLYIADTTEIMEFDGSNLTPYGINPGFIQPVGLAVDGLGNLYVWDIGTHKIYKINRTDQTVSVLAGSSNGFKNGSGSEAKFDTPYDLYVDEDFNRLCFRFRKSSNP